LKKASALDEEPDFKEDVNLVKIHEKQLLQQDNFC
jgi:hypothetical protein